MNKTILIPMVLGVAACGGGGGGSGGGGQGAGTPPDPAVAFASSGYAKAGETLPTAGNGKTFTVISLSETGGLDQNGDGKIDGDDAEITIAFSDDGSEAVVTIEGESYTLAREITIDNSAFAFPEGTVPKKYLLDDGVTKAEVSTVATRTYTETISDGVSSFTFNETSLDFFGSLDLGNATHGNVGAFYGFTSDPDALKAQGTATYTTAIGFEIGNDPDSENDYFANGRGNLAANFADGKISGNFFLQAVRNSDEGLESPPTLSLAITMDGDITGNTFASDMEMNQIIPHSGSNISASGIFFGPTGEELGGAIVGTIDTQADGTKEVGGVLFGAKD